MRTSRFKKQYRTHSSKLHRKVGDILREGTLFSANKIYQEYPVSKIDPEYPNNSHRFDWVILDLKIVIECHGEQHYTSVNFGGIDDIEALSRKIDQSRRDQLKADAAIRAGFTYIEIPYKDLHIISEGYIWDKYILHKNPNSGTKRVHVKHEPNDYEIRKKEMAKQARKEAYRRKKEWLKAKKQE